MPYPTINLKGVKALVPKIRNDYSQWRDRYWEKHETITYDQLNSSGQLAFIKFIKKNSVVWSIKKPDGPSYQALHEALLYLNARVSGMGDNSQGFNNWHNRELSSLLFAILCRKKPLSNRQIIDIIRYMAPNNTEEEANQLISKLRLNNN
jgi:hypothetical protein